MADCVTYHVAAGTAAGARRSPLDMMRALSVRGFSLLGARDDGESWQFWIEGTVDRWPPFIQPAAWSEPTEEDVARIVDELVIAVAEE